LLPISQESNETLCDFDRIKEFDTSGNLIKSWGTKGTGDGEFLLSEHVNVADTGNCRIQVFTAAGESSIALAP
jgi:hypothetical protein